MIEESVNQLTAAIRELTAALKAAPLPTTASVTVTESPAPAPAPKKAKTEPKPTPAATPEPTPAPVAATPEPTPAETPALTIAELRGVAQKVLDAHAKKGTDGVAVIRALNTKFEIKKVGDCPPEKFAALFAELQSALEAVTT